MSGTLPPDAYEELVSHSIDILTVLDECGIVQYESPSLQRLLGYAPDELVGERVLEYVHPDDREAALETFYEVIESSESYTTGGVEMRFRHKDGSWVWLESRGSNQTTAIGGYVVLSRDISERKRYERELERERDRLKRFTRVVSHDLRNPLSVAEGHLELARESDDGEHLATVARAHDRMDALIEDLLRLAREGWDEPQLDAVDLRETVEECWQQVDTRAATLDVETGRSILADEGQLRHLLENLVRNAVEHGGEAVTLTVGDLDDGFYVEDDGRGFPDDGRDSLLEYGVSTEADGTGLGLAIVNEIVEKHGWDLRITDGEDGGARVEIRDIAFLDSARSAVGTA